MVDLDLDGEHQGSLERRNDDSWLGEGQRHQERRQGSFLRQDNQSQEGLFGSQRGEYLGRLDEEDDIESSRVPSSSILGSAQSSAPTKDEKKKDEKKDIPFPTEPSFFKRAANRVIQFFKDIVNAFGHLFSWRSAKDEVLRSGQEFLARPEIRSVFTWLHYEKPKSEYEKYHPGTEFKLDRDPRTPEGHQQFVQRIVDNVAMGYGWWLEEQDAAKKQKQSDASSISLESSRL
jgi:hypothetical protein